ncbi:Crp/Fnr family transcriptional regulator [Mesorhizobium sp. RP14(2022)]|uniref:Crp/Fnr family transcriptional regulator n=1 Tax=Mesorhizobium liriopis TaxID=2953882 RepID=A0ABT1C715_9HYPH|nr:Crp/Fnr family transcriptional regulator [Mesorhizobium liriopis]MCO6050621.1 Crp/Fnr family transcriptional regulator [Mesorhizobium liriopis]
MSSHSSGPVGVFTFRLNAVSNLSSPISYALGRLVGNVRTFPAHQDIVRQGDRPSQCCVVLRGWVSRNKVLEGGVRQITALHIPSTIPDLQSLMLPQMDHNITTVTSVEAGFIPHSALRHLMTEFPSLALAFWKETLIDGAIAREWEVNLGSRPAAQRIAHLFCEMATRLEHVGQADRIENALSFPWPLTQGQLGEATGLSAIHINRTLQELRARGLIEFTRQQVQITDLDRLTHFAGFNPDYLLSEKPGQSASLIDAYERAVASI